MAGRRHETARAAPRGTRPTRGTPRWLPSYRMPRRSWNPVRKRPLRSGDLGKLLESSVGIAETLERHAHFVEQGRPEIRQRRTRRESQMTSTPYLTASACEQKGEIVVIVKIAVADARPVNDHRVIQQRAVAVGRRPHFLEELRK